MHSLFKTTKVVISDKPLLESQPKQRIIKLKMDQCIFEKIISLSGQETQKIYVKQGFLGRGGFANCYITQQIGSERLLATKIIAKSNLSSNRSKLRLMNEIKIHKTFRHQNVVEFIHYFQDPDNVYIMLQLCENESLNQLMRERQTFTTPEIQSFMLGICNGVKYLHSKKYIHRDLKLGNIFLNDKFQIKIGDFGLTSQLEFLKQNKRTVCGTPNYIAPEVLEGTGYYFQVDIWAIGIILYTLFYGYPPFEADLTPQIYTKIRNCDYLFPKHPTVPYQAIDLIRSILIPDPTKRPSLDEILASQFMLLNKGIPLQLPICCLTRPPTRRQLQSIPHYKPIQQKRDRLTTQTKQDNNNNNSNNSNKFNQKVTRDCTTFSKTIQCQQRTSGILNNAPINNGLSIRNTLNTQQDNCKEYNIVIGKKDNDGYNATKLPNRPDTYIQQFQQIPSTISPSSVTPINNENYYFCTNNLILGIYSKNNEVVFRHISAFSENNPHIYQIKLISNLFTQRVSILYSQCQHKGILNLKAKQILKINNMNINQANSNISNKGMHHQHSKSIGGVKGNCHQRCASNPNLLKINTVNINNNNINNQRVRMSGYIPPNNFNSTIITTKNNDKKQQRLEQCPPITDINQMLSQSDDVSNINNNNKNNNIPKIQLSPTTIDFLSKISKLKGITILRLSNKNIQIIFDDLSDGFILENKSGNIFYYQKMSNLFLLTANNNNSNNNNYNKQSKQMLTLKKNRNQNTAVFYQIQYQAIIQIIRNNNNNKQNNKNKQNNSNKTANFNVLVPIVKSDNSQQNHTKAIITSQMHKRVKSSLIGGQQNTKINNIKNTIKISIQKLKYLCNIIEEMKTKQKNNRHVKNRLSQ